MLSPPRDLQFLFGAVAATSDKNRMATPGDRRRSENRRGCRSE
jgi:hypothetical protein